jgi:ComF family protein
LQPLSAEFFCVSCRTPFQNPFPLDEEGRCGLCRSGLPGFDSADSFGAYDGPLRQLIHLFKYEKAQTLAGPLSDVLAAALPRDQQFDFIAPAPLHWRRRWHRGFNQADLLARRLARRTGIPVIRALRRLQPTQTQAGLSNTARRRNLARAFCVRRGAAIEGKRILLVDDVMTNGSTGSACVAALKRAGAAKVALLMVARVDRRMDVHSIDVRHTNRGRIQQAARAAGESE